MANISQGLELDAAWIGMLQVQSSANGIKSLAVRVVPPLVLRGNLLLDVQVLKTTPAALGT